MLTRLLGIKRPATLTTILRSRKLRVVINALHAKSGGGVTYLHNILPLLADDERLEIHLFIHCSQLGLFHPLDERIVVHAFDFPKGFLRLMSWEQFVLPVMAHVMSADLIFAPANFGSLLAGRQVILLRNALAVARTEMRWSKRAYWFVLGAITLISLMRCARAIAVSKYAADSLSMGMGAFCRKKIKIVHHGIGNRFVPSSDGVRQDFLLAVSDIYVQKNLHTLFHAIKIVVNKYPNIQIMIAGQMIDQWYYNMVVNLSKSLSIENNICFLGRLGIDELINLYQNCRLFVFPSTAETFGNPLVEAMACGAPVVCSNATAMPEIVGDGALLFDPLDVGEIAETILKVIDDPELQAELSRRGLAQASKFSWSETASKTADVLIEAGGKDH